MTPGLGSSPWNKNPSAVPSAVRIFTDTSSILLSSAEDKLFCSQVANLVTHLRRFFELESLGRLAHFFFHPRNELVEFFLRLEFREAVHLLGDVRVIRFHDLGQRHIQPAH